VSPPLLRPRPLGPGDSHRTIDGFLANLPYDKLLPALREVNVTPLERPVVDIVF
jgi:hypothetical protein